MQSFTATVPDGAGALHLADRKHSVVAYCLLFDVLHGSAAYAPSFFRRFGNDVVFWCHAGTGRAVVLWLGWSVYADIWLS